jgi:hypothetical protein
MNFESSLPAIVDSPDVDALPSAGDTVAVDAPSPEPAPAAARGPGTMMEIAPARAGDVAAALAELEDGASIDAAFAACRAAYPQSTELLLQSWGTDAHENFRYAAVFVAANPDLAAIVERQKAQGDPCIIELAAAMARRSIHGGEREAAMIPAGDRAGDLAARAAAERAEASADARAVRSESAASFQRRVDAMQREIDAAVAARDDRRADDLYRRKLHLRELRDGARDIVNGRRTA